MPHPLFPSLKCCFLYTVVEANGVQAYRLGDTNFPVPKQGKWHVESELFYFILF